MRNIRAVHTAVVAVLTAGAVGWLGQGAATAGPVVVQGSVAQQRSAAPPASWTQPGPAGLQAALPSLQLVSTRPRIIGEASVGRELRAIVGTWTSGTTFSYQWLRDGRPISGATGRSLRLSAEELGDEIRVRVTGSRAGYEAETRTSSATDEVRKGYLEAARPVVAGTVRVGSLLSVELGTWTSGTKFSYQWLRNGDPISGATGSTRRLITGDLGEKIAVKVKGSKPGYHTKWRASGSTPDVARGILEAETPTVSGPRAVPSVLAADPGNWTSGTRFSYQWLRAGSPISDATSSTYRLRDADAGKPVSVRVTGTKSGYTKVTRTSSGGSPIKPRSLSGEITGERVLGRHVYLVDGHLSIAKGATLTIPAGAVLKFQDYAWVDVFGTLNVKGTGSSKVVFTSVVDDSAKGDSNGDGARTSPAPGQPWGVQANAGATVNAAGLDFRYGDSFGSEDARRFSVTGSTFRDTAWDAVFAKRSADGKFKDNVINVVGNTLTRAGGLSITSANAAAGHAPIVVKNNAVRDFTGRGWTRGAYWIIDAALRPSNLTGNTGTGNKANVFQIDGRLVENWTFPTGGLPRVFSGTFTVAPGAVLNVPAGAVLKFQADAGLVNRGTVNVAAGSAKAIFTSYKDDLFLGDTNGDGPSRGAAGDWDGLSGTRVNGTNYDVRYETR